MSRLTQKQTLLLTVSGEVSPAARRAMMSQVSQDPALNSEYHEIREGMELLSALPIPEPSAAERREIPALIKKNVHQALHEKEAAARFSVIRYAVGTLAIAASLVFSIGLWTTERSRTVEQVQFAAHLNATIDRLSAVTSPVSPMLAQTITLPPQTDQPSLANLSDREGANSRIWNGYDFEDAPASDPSGPAGSY